MSWYKDKTFWKLWVVHSLIAIILSSIFALPFFKLILENAGAAYTNFGVWYFLFVYLTAIWITQFIAFALYSPTKIMQRTSLLIGAYINVSLPVVVAWTIMNRYTVRVKWLRYLLLFLCTVIFWKLLSELIALYTILFSELYFVVLA